MSFLNLLNIPVQLIFLDIVSIVAAIGLGYYAFRMFFHMRWGRLEKGWRLMAGGAVAFATGYVFLTIEDFFLAYSFYYRWADYIGTTACGIGLVMLLLGLRSHYIAWSPKKESPIRNE